MNRKLVLGSLFGSAVGLMILLGGSSIAVGAPSASGTGNGNGAGTANGAVTGAASSQSQGAAYPATCQPSWSVVPNPHPSDNESFNGVSALSPNDIWAVGYELDPNSPCFFCNFIEHWNGVAWSVVPSPNTPFGNNVLQGVATLSATDVWAAGAAQDASGNVMPLVLHYDGRAWSIVPSPGVPGDNFDELYGVAALSSNNVWFVGNHTFCCSKPGQGLPRLPGAKGAPWGSRRGLFGNAQTLLRGNSPATGSYDDSLVMHWDGHSISVVPSPTEGSGTILGGVTALSAHNVWAVGVYFDDTGSQTVIEHWDGGAWSIVPSPPAPISGWSSQLVGVSGVSPQDVWAVGEYYNSDFTILHTMAVHYDGRAWSLVPTPDLGTPQDGYLSSVAAISSNDVWAVGFRFFAAQTITEHWDGMQWSVVPSPSPDGDDGLFGVTAVNPNDVWAVGDGPGPSLVEQYAKQCP